MGSITAPRAAGLSIGEVSQRTGIHIETIRYYERIGMLSAPPRTASGRRIYGAIEARTLTFIRRSRELGFSLDEIRALLSLSGANGQQACAEARALAANHLAEVRAKIADLKAMEGMLADAVRQCDAGKATSCPLINTLCAK
jgi:MerR family mercuric resistance operon transcriptional regulator